MNWFRQFQNVSIGSFSVFIQYKVFSSISKHFLFQLSSQYELWAEQLQNGELPRGKVKDAEVQLRNLSDHLNHIQAATYEVAQRGQDLLQVTKIHIF